MKWCVLALLLLTTSVCVWAQPKPLTTAQQVAAQLGRAHEQLLLVTPSVSSKPLAEALRRAAAERGVQVFIVVAPAWAEAPGSYVASLALLEGVRVRLAETERQFVVVDVADDAFVIEGSLVSASTQRFDERPTYAFANPQAVGERALHFAELWRSAVPYRSFIYREEVP